MGLNPRIPCPRKPLVRVFAVVDETIRRRLGLWKIFDLPDGDDEPSITDARSKLAATGRGRYPGERSAPSRRVYTVRPAAGPMATPTDWTFGPPISNCWLASHLYHGRIVEMAAGEGKTVARRLPGGSVWSDGSHRSRRHPPTTTWPTRDCELLAPVYRALGLTVGAVLDHMAGPERCVSYGNRIVYGTLREFAFDYLRDRLVMSPNEQVQGPLDVAIIDEAPDQTLLDEAVTPPGHRRRTCPQPADDNTGRPGGAGTCGGADQVGGRMPARVGPTCRRWPEPMTNRQCCWPG